MGVEAARLAVTRASQLQRRRAVRVHWGMKPCQGTVKQGAHLDRCASVADLQGAAVDETMVSPGLLFHSPICCGVNLCGLAWVWLLVSCMLCTVLRAA